MAVLYDLTEFLNSPTRSGARRVAYEIARHWPEGELVPACVGPDARLRALPDKVFGLMSIYFGQRPGDAAAAARDLRGLAESARPLGGELASFAAVLNPEAFSDHARAALYEGLLRLWGPDRVFFVVYDMLPWLPPEWPDRRAADAAGPYLRLLRQLPGLSFLSRQARDDFLTRVLREPRPVGPVLAPGADGLGRFPPDFRARSRRFAVVGALEPRKNHLAALEAFERLWAEGQAVELVFLGRPGRLGDEALARLEAARQRPGFAWLTQCSDEAIVRVVRSCRATIYPSRGEGYGLPPLESLALGKPVIVTDGLPCTASLPPAGQLRLATPDAEHIYHAVRRLLDDDCARRLHEEIRSLRLPTWADLSRQVRDWVFSAAAPARRAA